jgi:hypothetical protein
MATISHLLLAMMYYPDPFQKARDEIIRVIGTERLPTFSDRASLPYGMDGLSYNTLSSMLIGISGMHFERDLALGCSSSFKWAHYILKINQIILQVAVLIRSAP